MGVNFCKFASIPFVFAASSMHHDMIHEKPYDTIRFSDREIYHIIVLTAGIGERISKFDGVCDR